jgi:hypothetical protein
MLQSFARLGRKSLIDYVTRILMVEFSLFCRWRAGDVRL